MLVKEFIDLLQVLLNDNGNLEIFNEDECEIVGAEFNADDSDQPPIIIVISA